MNIHPYALVFHSNYDTTIYNFIFESTEELPYPDIQKCIEKLELEYNQDEESVYLVELNIDEPVLRAYEVGTHNCESIIDMNVY